MRRGLTTRAFAAWRSSPASAGSDTDYVSSVEPGPLSPTGPRLKGEVGSSLDFSLSGTSFT